MEELDIIVGLDIGSSTIKIVVAQHEASSGKLNIIALDTIDSIGVNKGLINNIDEVSGRIENLIYNISKSYNIEINTVNLSIKDYNITNLKHKFATNRQDYSKAISALDIENIINDAYELAVLPGKTILHVNPLYYNLDNETGIINPIGRLSTHLEANFNIIIGRTSVLHNLYKCIEKINLQSEDVLLSSIAASNTVLVNEEKEAGVIVVNIGHETIEISIFHEGILQYINIISVGSKLITNDIAEGLQILPKQAEYIKKEYGEAINTSNNNSIPVTNIRGEEFKTISSKDLNYIIQTRAEELFEYIIEEIKNSKISSKLLGGIIFTGGGAKLKNLDLLAKHMFNIPVRIGNTIENINGSYKEEAKDPTFATAIGLILNNKNNLKGKESVKPTIMKKKPSKWFDKIIKKGLIGDILNNDIKDKDFIK